MLTKLTIRNFKRFGEVEIELGSPVVFIGPNNSGKTSAMQALALWDIGLKRWNEKRSGKKSTPEKRPGVTVNRQNAMSQAIEGVESALKTLGKGSPWNADLKARDDFLVPLFKSYFETLGLPNLMAKKNFYELAEHVPDSEIDPEISEKLDVIVQVAESATPAGD